MALRILGSHPVCLAPVRRTGADSAAGPSARGWGGQIVRRVPASRLRPGPRPRAGAPCLAVPMRYP